MDTQQKQMQADGANKDQAATFNRRVTVQLFAGAAAAVGQRVVEVDVAADARVSELAAALAQAYPELQPLLQHSRWAIGNDFVPLEQRLDGATSPLSVAMIPPVSGG